MAATTETTAAIDPDRQTKIQLTRKAGELIRIGGDVIIAVNRIRGKRVSIDVFAPASTRVLRGELAK